MGRAADPRLTVRLSPSEHAAIDGAAVAAGVETGGLLKAAAMRGLGAAVADLEGGRLRVRARSGAASSRVAKAERAVHPAVAARRAAGLL